MEAKVRRYMEQFHMTEPGDRVLAAVSGGADSVALLLILHTLREELQIELEVLHVEHGIRGEESRSDARFTEALCGRLGIPCRTYPVDVPAYAGEQHLGLEEAARLLRYEAFRTEAAKTGAGRNTVVALAHHMEDNAETILFQEARGTGLRGLCGMSPVRNEESVRLVRPLLGCTRDEIEAYLARGEQDFCTDSTNGCQEYSRNRIRSRILPEMKTINAQAVLHISEMAEQLRLVNDYMEAQAAEARLQLCRPMREETGIEMDAEGFRKLHPAVQGPLLLQLLSELAGAKKDITAANLADICALAANTSGKKIKLPYHLLAEKEYGRLLFRTDREVCGEWIRLPEFETEASCSIPLWKGRLECRLLEMQKNVLEAAKKQKNPYTKWFDYDIIKRGLCIRTRQSADYLVIDSCGHRKKLQNYMTDRKIPVRQREWLPLLARDSEILWVLGDRMGETGKVTEDTKRVLEINYLEE